MLLIAFGFALYSEHVFSWRDVGPCIDLILMIFSGVFSAVNVVVFVWHQDLLTSDCGLNSWFNSDFDLAIIISGFFNSYPLHIS